MTTNLLTDDYVRVQGICHDCGLCGTIHPDSDDQRGEPICVYCVALGAFAP